MNRFLTLTAAEIKNLRALKSRSERSRQGLFIAEGDHLTGEALQEGIAKSLLLMEGKQEKFVRFLDTELPVYLLPERTFLQVSDTKTPQGIIALCVLPDETLLTNLGKRIVALNAVQDPGNVGTIIRSLEAAGFTGLLLDSACADPFSPKAIRASMGSVFRIPVSQAETLETALQGMKDYVTIAAALDGEPFYQRDKSLDNICLLIGSEGAGLSVPLLKMANLKLKLPMHGQAESLNAAVAASVMMYDFVRMWEEQA